MAKACRKYEHTDFSSLLEKILIGYLKLSKVSKGKGAIVFLMMDTDAQMMEMCQFLKNNPEATESEILARAERIAKTM